MSIASSYIPSSLSNLGYPHEPHIAKRGAGQNRLGVKTLFIEPGSPWKNGYIESFNGKQRDELLNREVFCTLTEAKVLIEQWRKEYNQVRPHSSLGYRSPAPEAIIPVTLT